MALLPLRDLGKIGVVTDVDPYDIPINAFTMAVNYRFDGPAITDAPVCRRVSNTLSSTSLKTMASYTNSSGATDTFYTSGDGRVYRVDPAGIGTATDTNLSESTWVDNSIDSAFTLVELNNVLYVNRADRVPWYRSKSGGGLFQKLTNWNSAWRCEALRAMNGQLIAINMTESGVNYPNKIRWSDLSVYDTVPGTWTAGTTNSAGSNLLAELKEPLIDGWPLRDRMMLYSKSEVWIMQPTGDSNVFSFYRAFGDSGVINQNCVVEIGGIHYVFGNSEIYKHDGINKIPLTTGRINRFIYENLPRANVRDCFVAHNPKLSEIMFCYPSMDAYCNFQLGTYRGCNRAAVFNYQRETWYFYDLPMFGGMCFSAFNLGDIYSSITSTYDSVGGAYLSFGDTSQIALIGSSNPGLNWQGTTFNARILSFELISSVAHNGPFTSNVNSPAYLERQDLDLDELAQGGLTGNKLIRSVYPEGRVGDLNSPMLFWVGTKMLPNEVPVWEESYLFDGSTNYKLDYNVSGRYLSWRVTQSRTGTVRLSGMDIDVIVLSRR